MNKAELVEQMARAAAIPKATASKALDAFVHAVTSTLKEEGSVTLVGFGTFSVAQRKARVGRNPRTGGNIDIRAAKLARFKPGKALKDAIK